MVHYSPNNACCGLSDVLPKFIFRSTNQQSNR